MPAQHISNVNLKMCVFISHGFVFMRVFVTKYQKTIGLFPFPPFLIFLKVLGKYSRVWIEMNDSVPLQDLLRSSMS